jgi:cytochrome c oxidase subunit 4
MSEHIVQKPTYYAVFAVLVVGTILTYTFAQRDFDWVFPGANTLIALAIAFAKATCVVLWFMHVKYSPRLIGLFVVSSVLWLIIMFAFTMSDYLTRGAGTFEAPKTTVTSQH